MRTIIFDLLALASAVVILAAIGYTIWHGVPDLLAFLDSDDGSLASLSLVVAILVFAGWIKSRSYNR